MVTVNVVGFSLGTIEGIVWLDANADGIKDISEGGINGISVSLINNATGLQVAITNTNPSGNYTFANLNPGIYYVRFNSLPSANHRVSPKNVGTDDTVDSDASTSSPYDTSSDPNTITANETFDDIFMGLFVSAKINGRVWEDFNADGQRNGADGICPQNINVTLLTAGGAIVTTNASGGPLANPVSTNNLYTFNDLAPDDYKVSFSEPGGVFPAGLHLTKQNIGATPTDSDPDRVSGETNILTLNGVDITNIDAGYFRVSKVSDFVWEDLNGDGQQGGEPPLGGIEVDLVDNAGAPALDPDGLPIPQTVTTGGGLYFFDEVPPGTYKVKFQIAPIAASGNTLYFTKQNVGADATDSDANITTGESEPAFTFISGSPEKNDVDAGYVQKCTIGDFTFEDLNGDGIQAGDPGLDGVAITITKISPAGPFLEVNGTTAYTVGQNSAGGGAYLYDNLAPGVYKLTFTGPANYFPTLADQGGDDNTDSDIFQNGAMVGMTTVNFTCMSGDEIENVDAGFYRECKISDFVWHDLDGDGAQGAEPGLGGIQVMITDVNTGAAPAFQVNGTTVYNGTITSSGAGAYIFDKLPPGRFKLTFTDLSGAYKLTLLDATGDDKDNDADIAMGGMTANITCESGTITEDVDAGFFTKATLKGVAWHDSDGDGIKGGSEPLLAGVTMTLINTTGPTLDINGMPVAPVVTLADGTYTFNDLRPGIYTMTANLAGWLFTIPLAGGPNDSEFDAGGNLINDLTLLSGQLTPDINVGLYKLITVGGNIWGEGDNNSTLNPGETGGTNVLVKLCKAIGGEIDMTNADINGVYQFTDVVPGIYIIKIDPSNFVSGGPLYGLKSCDGQAGDTDMDNDDNGAGESPTTTVPINLFCGQEPGTDGVINETIDFCFKSDCNVPNALTKPSCGTVTDTICDLNILSILCSRMPAPPLVGPAPDPLCAEGGTPHNMSWFAFVAGGGNYTLNVDLFGCAGGQSGAQMGIYEIQDCDFGSATEIFCKGSPCVTGLQSVPGGTGSMLVPGKTYYLWFDGCAGSVCSYKISIEGNFLQYQIPVIDRIECSSSFGRCDTICPNNTITFKVEDANNDYDDILGNYKWKITDPNNIVTIINTKENILKDFAFTKLGVYKVRMDDIRVKCSLPVPPFEIQVVVANPPDEDWGIHPICEIDLSVGWTPLVVYGTSITDPNGDGQPGWFGQTLNTPGKKMFNITTPKGCKHKQSVEIIKLLNSKPIKLDTFLCPGESVKVGFATYKIEVWPRDRVTFKNEAGCDSLVDLGVGLLNMQGFVEDLGCINGQYKLQFVQTAVSNNPMANLYPFMFTYVWKDAVGNIITDGDPDNDPRTIIITMTGDYTCTVTMSAKNSMCDFDFGPLNANLNNLVPPQVTMASPWPVALCQNNAIVSYTLASTENPLNIRKYIWTVPASAKILGKKDTSTITVDWTNSTGGKICASIQGECGISIPLCDSVVVTPIPTGTLPALADICINKTTSITATTSNLPTYNYAWKFDGGTANTPNPTGPGPHLVSWGNPGVKNIVLNITDKSCVSADIKTSINVVESVDAPEVECDGSLGEVVFTWPAVIGATSYNVKVLTSQMGTLTGNASTGFTYKVTGLGLLEQVDIELTTLTNSPCGNLISTSGCFAQNCNPPDVTLDPVPDICLTAATTAINLNAVILPASSQGGTYEYSGNGITNTATGKFDPKLANLGTNKITLKYTSPDQCIEFATLNIVVNETPTSDFISSEVVVCQDSSVNITYTGNITSGGTFDWAFGDVVSAGNGKGPFDLDWKTSGDKTVSLTVSKNGCTSSPTTLKIKVEPRVEAIDIECTDQQPTEISVGWNAVANAKDYTLFIDGIKQPNGTVLTNTITGLTPSSVHFYEVIANSKNSCPGTKDTVTCIAVNCPPITIKFSAKDTTICLNSGAKPFKIVPTITGGLMSGTGVITWSGKGIDADGNFDPATAGVSTGAGHKITLDFVEGTCKQTKSINIRVLLQPKATFDMADKLCIDDELNINYTGTTGQQLDWKTPTGTVITPNGVGKYKAKFANAGTYKIGLIVGSITCPSELVENTVKVEPKLDLVEIKCKSTLNSVEFTWADIDCATQYEVIVDGVNKGKLTDLKYLSSGLAEGTKVNIEVLPVSECLCPGVKVSKQCEAKACPTITMKLSASKDKFCEGDQTATFQMNAVVTGSDGSGKGTWTGPHVNAAGLFDPKDVPAGVYNLKYTFTEENCTFEEKIDVTVFENPKLSAVTTSPDCYTYNFGTVIPTATGGDGIYSFRLDGNAVTLPEGLTKIEPGNHILIVNDSKGCDASTSFKIDPALPGAIEASGAAEILKGEFTSFLATIKSIPGILDSVVWTNSAGQVLCSGPNCLSLSNLKPETDDTYCAAAYYNSGCKIQDCFSQIVRPLIEIILPNIIRFGDRDNGGFFIQNYANIEIVKSMSIYDRWGNLVFKRENFKPGPDQSNTWDGKLGGKEVVPGVYVYTIDLVKVGGKDEKFNGDVTVVK